MSHNRKHRLRSRAQSSIDALVSFAVLLSALLILTFAARGFAGAFVLQSQEAGLKISLAHEALLLDTSAWAAGSSRVQQNISAVPVESGSAIACRQSPRIQEKVFSSPSPGLAGGVLHVDKTKYEPV